ncbi:hypothetical protein ACFVAD_20385 [Sutcliffiella sp. NPDC057660]|uniref:hypothetical protein n=1 Tax=Sutcliffiella sp. NPDC057660 TaxID=3346199 RepID=UPI0036BE1FB3
MTLGALFIVVVLVFINEIIGKRLTLGGVDLEDSNGSKMNILGKGFITLIFLSIWIIAYINNSNNDTLRLVFVCGIASILLYQSILEWKFLVGKKHISSLLTTFAIIVVIFL